MLFLEQGSESELRISNGTLFGPSGCEEDYSLLLLNVYISSTWLMLYETGVPNGLFRKIDYKML